MRLERGLALEFGAAGVTRVAEVRLLLRRIVELDVTFCALGTRHAMGSEALIMKWTTAEPTIDALTDLLMARIVVGIVEPERALGTLPAEVNHWLHAIDERLALWTREALRIVLSIVAMADRFLAATAAHC